MAEVKCEICGRYFKRLPTHLRVHSLNTLEYLSLYPGSNLYSEEHKQNMSRNTSGIKNSMYGKHHSCESKEKIAQTKIGNKEIGEKISRAMKVSAKRGREHHMFGKKHSPEVIKTLSEKAIARLVNGFNLHANHKKGYFFSRKNNKNIWYDSSYELRAFELLEIDESVVQFSRNKIRVPYVFEGVQRFCLPDLLVTYIDGTTKIIEIKPKRKIRLIPKEGTKIDFMSIYFEDTKTSFEVWTERELGLLEDK